MYLFFIMDHFRKRHLINIPKFIILIIITIIIPKTNPTKEQKNVIILSPFISHDNPTCKITSSLHRIST
jgi:hypothetical protein